MIAGQTDSGNFTIFCHTAGGLMKNDIPLLSLADLYAMITYSYLYLSGNTNLGRQISVMAGVRDYHLVQ